MVAAAVVGDIPIDTSSEVRETLMEGERELPSSSCALLAELESHNSPNDRASSGVEVILQGRAK